MEILIPSLVSALVLGVLCCPALAQPAECLLNGYGVTAIPTFDLTVAPDWWLSGGFAAHPTGTIAVLALLFLISLLFFATENAKGRAEDGGVLGSARVKAGTESSSRAPSHGTAGSEPRRARLRLRLHSRQVPIRA